MTPTNATPTNVAIDSQNSPEPIRHSRATDRTSISDRPAEMTTAARVVDGRSASSAGSATSMMAMAIAPMTEVSWVCAPAASATGVRDELLLIGIPEKNPVARFAAPRPISSRSWFTSSPRRIDSVRDRTLVSVADTSAMPRAAGSRARMSRSVDRRDGQRRQADRQRADDRQPGRGGQVEDRAQRPSHR